MSIDEKLCPCCSGKTYTLCCKPYHQGAHAQTAEELMRSRYSAYALCLPSYIIKTTHPANSDYTTNFTEWKNSIESFSKGSIFKNLSITKKQLAQDVAIITFIAKLDQQGKEGLFEEESLFEKFDGRWMYKGARVIESTTTNPLTTSELRLLRLAYLGEEVLRKKGEVITNFDNNLKQLADHMVETMDACDGLGLAAPQVHHSIQMFVIRKPTLNPRGDLELGEVKVFINPKLVSEGKTFWQETEGCLSIPGIRGVVKRPKEITISYQDIHGKPITEKISGWEARVVLHEYDHLQGVLFIDHLLEKERKKLEPKLKALEKRFNDHKTL